MIADLQERHIRQIRKRFPATSKADLAVMLLRMLWVFAKEVLAMDLGPNPAAEIRNVHHHGWSHEPWPDWVIEKFEAEALSEAQRAARTYTSALYRPAGE